MRNNIVHAGDSELKYEIREIVEIGKKMERLGVKIVWENIGDPVAKGHKPPDWIRKIIADTVTKEDSSFAYSTTKGLAEARNFIASDRNLKSSSAAAKLDPEDILFFNGLGDAISVIYTYLNSNARVICPSPSYPTHTSSEESHAGTPSPTYSLNPRCNWMPDLEELRNKIKYNPEISGILIINPDNPTGMVYPKAVLREIVKLAREYDLFLICDEIYANVCYGAEKFTPLCEVIGDIPTIIMRGLSKEIPWPGGRCGWIEVYNKDKDPIFARYVKTMVDAKTLEVCSTTLPQQVLPKIFSDQRYRKHLAENNKILERKAHFAYDYFRKTSGVIVPEPRGAFYISVVFSDGVLNVKQKLKIENQKLKRGVEKMVENVSLDKRFVYYLMASTGICVVPLSGFNSNLQGFRMTLLERDEEKFKNICATVGKKITEYLKS